MADAQIRAVAEQRRQHDAERKKAADEASHVKYGMTSIADVGECFQTCCFSLYHEIFITRESYIYQTISWNSFFLLFFGNTGKLKAKENQKL